MDPNTEPTDDSLLDADLQDLNEVLDMDGEAVDLPDDDAEDPEAPEGDQEHGRAEAEDGGDPEDESEEEGEEPEVEEEDDGEEEGEQEEGDEKSTPVQQRIDELIKRSKTAEERVAVLESELEEAKAAAGDASGAKTTEAFRTTREIDERATSLRRTIRGLGDLVAGQPAWIRDPMSGEKVKNTVEVEGKEYEVAHVRARLHELEDEQADLPRLREALKARAAANAEARKSLPSAWQPGTPANAERLALLKDYPELRSAPDRVVLEAVVGRLALKTRAKAAGGKAKPSKTGRALKSGAHAPVKARGTKGGLTKQAVMQTMDVPDAEMAELAVALADA